MTHGWLLVRVHIDFSLYHSFLSPFCPSLALTLLVRLSSL